MRALLAVLIFWMVFFCPLEHAISGDIGGIIITDKSATVVLAGFTSEPDVSICVNTHTLLINGLYIVFCERNFSPELRNKRVSMGCICTSQFVLIGSVLRDFWYCASCRFEPESHICFCNCGDGFAAVFNSPFYYYWSSLNDYWLKANTRYENIRFVEILGWRTWLLLL